MDWFTVVLAGDSAGDSGVSGSDGENINPVTEVGQNPPVQERPAGLSTDMFVPFLFPALLIGVFYFLILRPQRKRDKETKEMLAGLKVGDKVASIGGIIGTISALKDDTVTLEVGADKTKLQFERAAIKGIKG